VHGEPARDAAAWVPPGQPRRRRGRAIFWILVALSVALIVAGNVLSGASTRSYRTSSFAMAKTLLPGDRVLVQRGAHARRGDIVLFSQPPQGGLILKRLIGLPGDHVACCDAAGRVTVNSKPLGEPYVQPGGPGARVPFSFTLAPGRIWVLGDYRGISEDSRSYGPLPASAIVGRAVAVGHLVPTTLLRTPQTFVADGLAPPDHRVPQFTWLVALSGLGVISLLILAVIGVIRSIIRRRRRRRLDVRPGPRLAA
jgi:signal peptidase I